MTCPVMLPRAVQQYEPVYYAKAVLTNKKMHCLNIIYCPVITLFKKDKAETPFFALV